MDRNIIRQDREVLKQFFKKGNTPTEEQFAELIDSMANIVEDGQVKQNGNGWAFYPTKNEQLNIGLYAEDSEDSGKIPAWTINITEDKRFIVKNEDEEAVVEISQDKIVTMHGNNEPNPANNDGYFTIPADKKWHEVPIDCSQGNFNCRVFNIYASCNDDTGYCQLTRATALWMNKIEQRIESPQKYWWGWSRCVRIRWDGYSKLQMRTRKKLSGEVKCRIVEMYKA